MTKGFYVTRYFYFAYIEPKTFIDIKRFPSTNGFSQLFIFPVKKGLTLRQRQIDVIAALKGSRKQTKRTKGEGVGIPGWQKTRGLRERRAPYPNIKKNDTRLIQRRVYNTWVN